MTQSPTILRGVIIYGTILPLAIFLGYLLSNPLSMTSFMWMGIIFLVLITPVVLRWHHPILFLSWNMTAVVFVPGRPQLWLVMAFVSLTISLLQYALGRNVRFIKTRSVLYPMLFIGAVVVGTAFLTGGVGLNVLGSEKVGGRLYLFIIGGIIGYIAMTAHPIPSGKANLYLGLFLLGALTNAIGSLVAYVPPALYPIFAVFPVERQGVTAVLSQESVIGSHGILRFYGLSLAFMGLAYFFIAKRGLGSLLSLRKPAFYLVLLALISSTFGGFRSFLILSLMTVSFVFFMEGLHRSRKMPVVLVGLVLAGVAVVGFIEHMPLSIQRSLSFLPLNVDPEVKLNARYSSDWRLEIWEKVLPEVPHYLLLGQGLAITAEELDMANTLEQQGRAAPGEIALLSRNYHNGPLSVVLPFGLWGVIGWIWLVVAGIRALYFNYRYSPPELKTINTFLFAYFLAKVVLFHLVFGAFQTGFASFAGLLGFSIALNHGIQQPVPAVETSKELAHGPLARPRLLPSFTNFLRG